MHLYPVMGAASRDQSSARPARDLPAPFPWDDTNASHRRFRRRCGRRVHSRPDDIDEQLVDADGSRGTLAAAGLDEPDAGPSAKRLSGFRPDPRGRSRRARASGGTGPTTSDGALRPGLVATAKFGGDCWTGSFVLHGGYRCSAGNFLYDPCFTDPTRDDAVLCMGSPFDRHVIRLRISGRKDRGFSARIGVVWGVRLSSGLRCTFVAGGATDADPAGRRMNYGCRNSSSVLWGNPIRKGRTWHIRLTAASQSGPERLVAISTAFIGRNQS
jgi:hypothetical protein